MKTLLILQFSLLTLLYSLLLAPALLLGASATPVLVSPKPVPSVRA